MSFSFSNRSDKRELMAPPGPFSLCCEGWSSGTAVSALFSLFFWSPPCTSPPCNAVGHTQVDRGPGTALLVLELAFSPWDF